MKLEGSGTASRTGPGPVGSTATASAELEVAQTLFAAALAYRAVEGRTPLDRRALGVPYQDASNIARWRQAADGLRCRGNTWFIPYDTIQSRDRERPHPATFPPRLPEYCLRLHGLSRIELVLDPFVGLGAGEA